jgi:3-oxoacyl-[acyl-carrier protein] reductase
VEEVTARTGRLDVLVNNAVQWVDPAQRRRQHELTRQQWEEVVGVNLFGTAQVTQQALPFMQRAQWGRIVTLSSDLALDSMPGSGPYSTLKAALLGFNANLVEEYSAEGILSNVVLPSWTLTARARKFSPAFQQAAALAFPTRRITEPEEVASLVLYLGSAANGHVNGEAIKVTGKGCQPILTSLFQQHRTALSVANKS